MSEEDSVHADVRAVFESLESETVAPEVAQEDERPLSQEQATRERDESGRFKGKAKEPEAGEGKAQAEEVATTAEEEGRWKEDRPPTSWSPKARERWSQIDPDVRKEIIRREEASVAGIRTMQENYAQAEAVFKGLEPYAQEARSLGVDFTGHVSGVLQTERALRTGDMPTKFNTLLRVADSYGIPLREVINQSVGAKVLASPQQQQSYVPPEIQQQLQELNQWREQMQYTTVANTVEGFGADKEFFQDVRGNMADIIDLAAAQGRKVTLDEAYDQACWMHPEVREVMLGRTSATSATNAVRSKQLKAAKAGVAPTASLDIDMTDEDDDSINAILTREMRRATSGRL